MLIQRRALTKYHTLVFGVIQLVVIQEKTETTKEAAERRLWEEMGLKASLMYGFKFLYKAAFDNGLIEHELDHVFFGLATKKPCINISEVCDYPIPKS